VLFNPGPLFQSDRPIEQGLILDDAPWLESAGSGQDQPWACIVDANRILMYEWAWPSPSEGIEALIGRDLDTGVWREASFL